MNIAPNQKFTFIEMDRDDAQARFDLRDMFIALHRRARLIALTALGVAIVVAVIALAQPRQYTATATIMIDPAVERVVSQEQALTEQALDAPLLESELEVIRSPELVERIIRELRLDRDPAWVGARAAAERVNLPPNAPVPLDLSARVSDAISARRRGTSYVIDLSVRTHSPRESARLANKLVEVYRRADFETRAEAGRRANDWLGSRLDALRQDVQQKEAAAQEFRARTGLLTSGGVSLTESQIGSVQTEVLRARADLAAAQARANQVQALAASGQSGESMDSVLASDTIRDLRQRESDLLRRQAGYENTLTDAHPNRHERQKQMRRHDVVGADENRGRRTEQRR